MEALENKTWWTVDEGIRYFGSKNRLAFCRMCRRAGITIRHGMVNKKEVFNCLARTVNVPRIKLYRCITNQNENQKQGDTNGHNQDDIRDHQDRLRTPQPHRGAGPAAVSGAGIGRPGAAAGVGRCDHQSPLLQPVGGGRLVGEVCV